MKNNILLAAVILLLVLETGCGKNMLQYNSNGISVRPCITINENIL